MYTKVHRLRDYVKGNTKSCVDLVNYLEKENKGKALLEKEYFFNHEYSFVSPEMVMTAIDHNVKGLKKDEARFFMLSVNPSQKELQHLALLACGHKVENLAAMSKDEVDRYVNLFKGYTLKVMDEYARAFHRDISKEDLIYFIKIEQQREFKGYDPEVKKGLADTGDLKPGLQTHAHIIVSRRDVHMEKSLSPLANSRGLSQHHQLNGKQVQVGFDGKLFKTSCEQSFDRYFNYDRLAHERFLESLKKTQLIENIALKTIGKAVKIAIETAWELHI